MKWTLGSYNRFIGSARKARTDLSVAEARKLYMEIRDREGKPVFSSYIVRHPKIFSQLAKSVQLEEAEKTVAALERRSREKAIDEEMEEATRGRMREPGEDEEEGSEWELAGKADYKRARGSR